MALLSEWLALDVVVAVAVLTVLLLYAYVTSNDAYWDRRGVANLRSGVFLRPLLGLQSQMDNVREIYDQFNGHRYAGLFQGNKPVLMVRDPELIQRVLVKDFSHFQDRGNPEIKNDPVMNNLSSLKGHVWKSMRNKLTPTFTTGKLRGMFGQVANSGAHLMARIPASADTEVEAKDLVANFTMEVISSCAFGLEFVPGSREYAEFKRHVMGLFRASVSTFARFMLNAFFPKLAGLVGLKAFPADSCDYFVNLVRATIEYRKTHSYQRNDYMQLLITLREQEEAGKSMTGPALAADDVTEDDDVILQAGQSLMTEPTPVDNVKLFTDEAVCANSIIFLTAGSDGTSSAVSFALFELCRRPEVQARAQREVDEVLAAHKGQWTYDAVRDMHYIEQIMQEAQRLYPISSLLQRECTKQWRVPDSQPPLVIEPGVLVYVPVIGLHMDPHHYPDPTRFDPDRFQGNRFRPSPTFLPFGDGPRICIAMRFAVMEMKACLARILAEYTVSLGPRTKVPLQFSTRAFIVTPKDGIHVTFDKRHK